MSGENVDFTKKYIPAYGPEGLRQVLENLLEKAKQDPECAKQPYIIMYQLGEQRSLIKVDMSKPPFQFWYNDVLGRPMTKAVEQTIANFLWEKCGEKERFHENIK